MKIIGIDPGYGRVGFGIIQKQNGYKHLASGIINTDPGLEIYDRINEIESDLEHLIKTHKPEYAVVEKLYFSKNTKTAMHVSEARGVICNLLNKKGIRIQEASPSQIKLTLTGNGNATKDQVEKMVKIHLKEPSLKAIDDAMDALAAAICFEPNQSFLRT